MHIRVFETNKVTGRTPIKVVLHEIHKSLDEFNKNGINWKREHVEKNIETVNGSPIVAEFLDESHDMPLGHGDPYIDEDGKVYFENSVVVGVLEKGSIEDLEINGSMRTVLVGEGHLFNQRFPKFIEWIRETNSIEQVKSSVEIGATPPNDVIVYDGGWKEEGRIPMEYQYTGHAILSEAPADDNAVLLEVNKFKEDKRMSKENNQLVTELNEKLETKVSELNELKNSLKEKDGEVTELNEKLETKAGELNSTIEELKEVKEKLEGSEKELNELRTFKKEQEDKQLQSELNAKLSSYTDEEKEVVKEKVEKFSTEPSTELLGEIVNEINSNIAKKIVESRKTQTETNSHKDDDIFGDIQDVHTETNSIEDLL